MCKFTIIERNLLRLKWLWISVFTLSAMSVSSQCDISCKANINVSLSETCDAVITEDMVLSLPVDGVLISVVDASGETLLDNTVTLAHVGQEVMVIATEPDCGNVCMSMALIEDKLAPIIECADVTIGCDELIVFANPMSISCDVDTVIVIGEKSLDISCESADYQQLITRAYQAYDSNGNASTVCEQSITIEKFDLGLIDFPINIDTTLYCASDYDEDENGNPRFDILGGPTLSGEELYPDQFLDCNTYISYTDEVLSFNQCVTNVIRTWNISNWFCGQDNIREVTQLYTIVDTVGPEFTCPSDLTMSVSGASCYGTHALPVLTMTDACANGIDRVDVNYTGGFLSDSIGGSIQLSAGSNTVEILGYDGCGNSNSCSYNVLVVDNAQPVTICDQFTTIALSTDGIAYLSADDLDDGSFDECSNISLEIRRVNGIYCDSLDQFFRDRVAFCCDEVGSTQMVALRVTDASFNSNVCMAFVEIQDKLPPVVLAELPDVTVACTFAYDINNLDVFGKVATNADDQGDIVITSEFVIFDGPARDALVIDNCTAVTSDDITEENINQCGLGYITRVVKAENPEGQSVTFTQRITFGNNEPFIRDSIVWPLDYAPTTSCAVENLQPDDLPEGYNFPTFTEDACDMIGLTYEDKILTNTPDGGGRFKIIRTWFISDWCQDLKGRFPVWEHEQIIEVMNSIAPVIDSGCVSEVVCVYDADCGPGYIELAVSGSDDCVGEDDLIWSYEIDMDSDGSVDSEGNTNSVAGLFAVGNHTITWTLVDGCGNSDVCTQLFEIRNCKAPTPYCLSGLTADLTAMDLDGDGNVDTEMLSLTPDYLDVGSSHPCGYDVSLSFSPDVNDTVRIFDCTHIGTQEINLWVTDVVNGNQDFCSTYIIVQDNNDSDFCESGLQAFEISGKILTESFEGIKDVAISLNGTDQKFTTDENGKYMFQDVIEGSTLSIVPDKNTDATNGVTTLDLVLIQKHILGIEHINNPYRILAGDINASGTITASDLIALRKLILGKYDEFPANSSWKFLDANHQFVQGDNPWASPLPYSYEINNIGTNMDVDFIGIKIGDVNYSVEMGSGAKKSEVRSEKGLNLIVQDAVLSAGDIHDIVLTTEKEQAILGYQFALNVNPLKAKIVAINGQSVDQEIDNVGTTLMNDGTILTNNFNSEVIELTAGDAIITVSVIAFEDMALSEVLSLNYDVLTAEVYNSSLEELGVDISFRDLPTSGTNDLLQNKPNPWSNNTSIRFSLANDQNVSLFVYDVAGKVVHKHSGNYQAGINAVTLSKADITHSGIYYYEIITDDFRAVKKMIVNQ